MVYIWYVLYSGMLCIHSTVACVCGWFRCLLFAGESEMKGHKYLYIIAGFIAMALWFFIACVIESWIGNRMLINMLKKRGFIQTPPKKG
jgi:hypothetical protein